MNTPYIKVHGRPVLLDPEALREGHAEPFLAIACEDCNASLLEADLSAEDLSAEVIKASVECTECGAVYEVKYRGPIRCWTLDDTLRFCGQSPKEPVNEPAPALTPDPTLVTCPTCKDRLTTTDRVTWKVWQYLAEKPWKANPTHPANAPRLHFCNSRYLAALNAEGKLLGEQLANLQVTYERLRAQQVVLAEQLPPQPPPAAPLPESK